MPVAGALASTRRHPKQSADSRKTAVHVWFLPLWAMSDRGSPGTIRECIGAKSLLSELDCETSLDPARSGKADRNRRR